MTFAAHSMPPENDLAEPLRGNLTREQQTRVDLILAWVANQKAKDPAFTVAKLCRAANVTHPLWSSLAAGKYAIPGTIDKHLDKMERAMNTQTVARSGNAAAELSDADFCPTAMWGELEQSVSLAIQLAHQGSEHKLNICVAPAGAGKTTASRRLAKLHTGLEVNASTDWQSSRRCMLYDIAHKLGLRPSPKDSSPVLSRAIREHFSSPKLLLINELGPHTMNSAMVTWWRELLNETQAVLTLCVVPESLTFLARRMGDELEQLEQRGRLIKATAVTVEDVQWFMRAQRKTEIATEAAAALAEAATEYGWLRMIKTVAALPTRIAPLHTARDAQAAAAIYRDNRHIIRPTKSTSRRAA